MKKIYFLVAAILFIKMAFTETCFAQLSGTYTIGGTTPNYATFTAAVSALITQGVSGPVVFHVRSNTYSEQISLPSIAGASSANTITFQSENNDSSSVTLTFPGSVSSTGNYTLQLNGGDFITFSKMTLERSGASTYTNVVDIRNTATNNTFSHDIITNGTSSGFSSGNALVSNAVTSIDSMNAFINNRFVNGTFGLYYFGTSAVAESGTIITDNLFSNQTVYGIQSFYQRDMVLSRNQFTSNVTDFASAVYLANVIGNSSVMQNKIDLTSGGSGISFFQAAGTAGTPLICANNFVHVNGGTQAYGIRCNGCSYMGIYFNSVNITSSTFTNNTALEITASGSIQNKVMNNILVSISGFCVSESNSAIALMDYNDLLNSSGTYGSIDGVTSFTFANWQSASGFDANSVSINPVFTSPSDLHIGSFLLNNIGVPAGNVTVDIDDQVRNVSTPDIGADEITPLNTDVGITRLITPPYGACGNNNTVVAAIVKNFAAIPVANISATALVTGTLTATLTGTHTGTIPVLGTDTIFFSPGLNTVAGALLNFKLFTTLAGDLDHSNDSLRVDTVSLLAIPSAPGVSPPSPSCPSDTAYVYATFPTSQQVYWYANPSGGPAIHVGNPLAVTPHVPTTYYAEVRDTGGSGTGCLRITECELNDIGGNGDYIEVQNCSPNAIDATGWVVAVSNDYTDINLVNSITWNLGVFAPGEIQVRYDVGTGADYWGQNILWNGGNKGWAMIVDNNGTIVDFVPWMWTATELQSMNVTINGFNITVGSSWIDSSVVSCVTGSITRIGSSDNDNNTDFVCASETYNALNANLSLPFTTCGAGGGCPSIRVPVLVNVLPPLVFLGNDTVIASPNTVTLNAGSGFTSYLWSNNATTSSITVGVAGTYWVMVTDANGCHNSDTIRVDVITGLNDLLTDNSIMIFPNPAKDLLSIHLNLSALAGKVMVYLYDETGRFVQSKEFIPALQQNTTTMNMSGLAKGVYYLEFRNEQTVLTKKIVKF